MDAWWQESPYSAVGVYIGGSNRVCQDQPELSAGWVHTQQRRGWHVLSMYVGPAGELLGVRRPDVLRPGHRRAAGAGRGGQRGRRRPGPRARAGQHALLRPRGLRHRPGRLPAGGAELPVGLDRRAPRRPTTTRASTPTSRPPSPRWTYADRLDAGAYTMPDDIWFAWANGKADTGTDDRVQSDEWDDHQRIHQYRMDITEAYGGYPLTIDANWVDVGSGSVAARREAAVQGRRRRPAPLPDAQGRARGARRSRPPSACSAAAGSPRPGSPAGTTERTAAAVRKAQKKLDLKVTGKLTRPTWAALFAQRSPAGPQGRVHRRAGAPPPARPDRRRPADDGRRRVLHAHRQGGGALPAQGRPAATGVVTPEVWESLA